MKKFSVATLVGIIVILAANLSFASIIYEQYATIETVLYGDNDFCYWDQFVAQDFTVTANTQLTKLTFNAFTTEDTQPLTDIYVKIYTNIAGSPGSLLYDEHITGTFSGVDVGWKTYTLTDYEVTLLGENLTVGTYWLALKVGPPQAPMWWTALTDRGTIGLASKISDDGLTWRNYSYEHSFRLEGNTGTVPLPGAILLLGAGLGRLALYSRRRQKAKN